MTKAKTKPAVKKATSQNSDDTAQLLQSILHQVAFDGWSRTTLVNGAQSLGLSEGHISLAYPHGVRDVVAAFSIWANQQMLAQIAAEKLYDRMRIRDKISYAVRARLETLAQHREAMRQLCLWYALPHHTPEAVKNLAQLCDIIWRTAGDTSTDFNFYSKRALLAYVIKTTTLFWLTDDSEEQKASWEFLDRRIAEVLQIGKMTNQLRDLPKHFSKINALAGFASRFRRAD